MAKPSNKVCISQVKVLCPVSYFSLDILTGQALTPDQTPVTSGHCQRRTEKHLTKQKSPLKLASFFASFFVNSLVSGHPTHMKQISTESWERRGKLADICRLLSEFWPNIPNYSENSQFWWRHEVLLRGSMPVSLSATYETTRSVSVISTYLQSNKMGWVQQ